MTTTVVGQREEMTAEKCYQLGVMYGRGGIDHTPVGYKDWAQALVDAFERGYLDGQQGSDHEQQNTRTSSIRGK